MEFSALRLIVSSIKAKSAGASTRPAVWQRFEVGQFDLEDEPDEVAESTKVAQGEY